jgi:hypothetical protein
MDDRERKKEIAKQIEQLEAAQGKKPRRKRRGLQRAGDIPIIKSMVKEFAPLTPAQNKLLDAATIIGQEPNRVELAFMARLLVQCTLPHSDPGNVPAWTRRNGNLTLTIRAGWDSEKNTLIGYPYGVIPRLLLFWIVTEVVRTKTRTLKLGRSLNAFMREVGLSPYTGGGKRSDAKRLRSQMERLFRSVISFEKSEPVDHGKRWMDMQIAPEGELWWDPKQPEQGGLWESFIVLGERFFQSIIEAPLPVDMRILRELRSSALELDLYMWATGRVFTLRGKVFITWNSLMQQMGAEYTDVKNFARKARPALRKISALYPALNLAMTDETRAALKGGFWLHPSAPSVPPAPKQIPGPRA